MRQRGEHQLNVVQLSYKVGRSPVSSSRLAKRLSAPVRAFPTELKLDLNTIGKEERLLAELCGGNNIGHAPTGDLDWLRFARLARSHCIESLIWVGLRRRPLPGLPPEIARRLQGAHQRNSLRGLEATSSLLKVIAALSSEGIPAIPLKGICVAARYYDDPSAREVGDIDLLVAPRDLARGDQVIKQLGYVQVSSKTHEPVREAFTENLNFVHHLSYIGAERVSLELHSRLHQNPALLPLQVAEIVRNGTSIKLGNFNLFILPDDLQFLFLATHGARHEWERLQWLYDIAVMVQRAPPAEVTRWLALAKKHGVANPAAQALVITHRVLGIPVPEEVVVAYKNSKPLRFMVHFAERTLLGKSHRTVNTENGLHLELRLYRLCMSSHPAYLWHEVRRGFRAFLARHTSI